MIVFFFALQMIFYIFFAEPVSYLDEIPDFTLLSDSQTDNAVPNSPISKLLTELPILRPPPNTLNEQTKEPEEATMPTRDISFIQNEFIRKYAAHAPTENLTDLEIRAVEKALSMRYYSCKFTEKLTVCVCSFRKPCVCSFRKPCLFF